jgi:ribonuclease J
MVKKSSLKIIPLGGLSEVGRNITLFEKDGSLIIVDCGLMFPNDDMLGIDFVIPDFSYLKKNSEKVKALIVTHGHEDHIGAIPYLIKELNIPIYASKLTMGLIKLKLSDNQIYEGCELNEINTETTLNIGPFVIDFFRVNHSIPDCMGLVINTDVGTIVHSGDFKIDQSPIDGEMTQFAKISSFGDKGVLALLCDSTNAEEPGYTLPERDVGKTLASKFIMADKRIIVATFSSHIHRIQQIIDVSHEFERKIAISGKSMLKTIKIACELGFLKIPENLIIPINKIDELPLNKITILSTGTQGEPLSALHKMALNEHKRVQIMKGDMVIISASPIPGNEKAISNIISLLLRQGADVFYESIAGVHVSGHAAQEEIKMMINLVKPKYFIPIHGENKHKFQNAKLAQDVGIKNENVLLAQNGDIIKLNANLCRISGNIQMRDIYIDGVGFGDVDDIVLKDRKFLSRNGVLFVTAGVDISKEDIFSEPSLTFKGIIYINNFDMISSELKDFIKNLIYKCFSNKIHNILMIEKYVCDRLEKHLLKSVHIRPVIVVKFLENSNGTAP